MNHLTRFIIILVVICRGKIAECLALQSTWQHRQQFTKMYVAAGLRAELLMSAQSPLPLLLERTARVFLGSIVPPQLWWKCQSNSIPPTHYPLPGTWLPSSQLSVSLFPMTEDFQQRGTRWKNLDQQTSVPVPLILRSYFPEVCIAFESVRHSYPSFFIFLKLPESITFRCLQSQDRNDINSKFSLPRKENQLRKTIKWYAVYCKWGAIFKTVVNLGFWTS